MRALPIHAAAVIVLLFSVPAGAKVLLPNGKEAPEPSIGCYGGKPGGLSAIFSCVCKTQSFIQ